MIIRTRAIGAVVMASPMLPVLRRAFPQARIYWLAEPQVADLLACNPDIAGLVSWPKKRWKAYWRRARLPALCTEMRRLAKELRRHRFDLVIDAQGLARSRLMARLSGAPERIGLNSKEPGRFLMTRIVHQQRTAPQMGSEYAQLMRELKLAPNDFRAHIVLCPHDRLAAHERLHAEGLRGPYAVFCPFTTRPQKHWPESKWAELAERVSLQWGLPVVLLGGAQDRGAAERLSAGPAHNFCGLLGLGGSAAVIQDAALVVGVDTGLTHLAAAFQRPAVALFGATRPYREVPGRSTTVLSRDMPCAPCRRRPTCRGEYTCMQRIREVDVMEAIDALIGPSAKSPNSGNGLPPESLRSAASRPARRNATGTPCKDWRQRRPGVMET